MHWFLPSKGFTPQTYTPGPGVMLPAPAGEDINKVIKPVEISGLDDTMAAVQFLTMIVERGTGTTAIDKAQSEGGVQTLGEIEILVGKSVERAIGMAKFYRMAWYETAWKWEKMMFANAPKILTLYKTGRSGKIYTKKVLAQNWKSKEGYKITVNSSSEQEQNEMASIQKWQFIISQHPENPVLRTLALKRELELLDLTPDELKQIEEAESPEEIQANIQEPQAQGLPQGSIQEPQVDSEEDELLNGISNSLSELNV